MPSIEAARRYNQVRAFLARSIFIGEELFVESNHAQCLVCERNNNEVPLLAISYQDRQYWICPSHLPILIHHPEQLTGRLPGVENLEGHSH